jgi:hypothetical protein
VDFGQFRHFLASSVVFSAGSAWFSTGLVIFRRLSVIAASSLCFSTNLMAF